MQQPAAGSSFESAVVWCLIGGRFANKRQKKIEGDDDVAAVDLTDDGRAATNDAVCVRAASGEVSEGGTRPRLLVGYLGYWRTGGHQNVRVKRVITSNGRNGT